MNIKPSDMDVILAEIVNSPNIKYSVLTNVSKYVDQLAELKHKYLKKDFTLEQCTIEIKRESKMDNSIFVVASVDNKIVGYICGESVDGLPYTDENGNEKPIEETIYLDSLAVDEEYRGQRISSNLMEKFEQYYKSRGIKYIVLHAKDDDAKSLYLHKGYKVIKAPFDTWENRYMGKEI